jgi:hypothetical protein
MSQCRAPSCDHHALENGYCKHHQYFAIENMLKTIKQLQQKILSLKDGSQIDPTLLENLQSQLDRTKLELVSTKTLCDQTPECKAEMEIRQLVVAIDQVIQQSQLSPAVTKQLQTSQQQLFNQSLATSPEGAKVESILMEQALSSARKSQTENSIQNVQATLQQEIKEKEKSRLDNGKVLDALMKELKTIQATKDEAVRQTEQAEQRLDQFRGEASESTGLFAQTIAQLRKDKKTYEELYHDMVAREAVVAKKVKLLQDQTLAFGNDLVKMKARYEQQLIDAQNNFAAAMVVGGQVLSEREQELEHKIKVITGEMAESKRLLEGVSQDNKALLNKDTNTARIARQMMDVNQELTTKQKEIVELQTKLSESRALVAQNEIRCDQQSTQAASKMREEINRLSDNNIRMQKDLTERQEQLSRLQNESYDLQRQQKLEMSAREMELQKLRAEHADMRRQKEQALADLRNNDDLKRQKLQHDELQLKIQFDRLKDTLHQQFRDRSREMELAMERKQLQLTEEKRGSDLLRKQIQETELFMKQKQAALDKTQAAFEEQQQRFLKEKADLESAAIQGRMMTKQFHQMEEDHKNRIRLLEQQLSVLQKRSESRIKTLEDELTQLKSNRNEIITSLERCSVGKEDVVRQVGTLGQEKEELKNKHAKLKLQTDQMKREYELLMTKLRVDASRLQSDHTLCSSRLQDASLVHDHTMRVRTELEQEVNNWKQKYHEAKGNEDAMNTLMRNVNTKEAEILKLRSANRELDSTTKAIRQAKELAEQELSDVKRRENDVVTQMQHLSAELQRLMVNQEAEIQRRKAQMEAREASLVSQLHDSERRLKETRMQVMALQGQKELTQNMLAETELDRAKQIDALMASQQLQDKVTFGSNGILPVATGKSSLLNV